MKNFLKKNFAVLAAFALPILLIIVVIITAYVPSLFVSTDYNFIYSVCTTGGDYNYYNRCNIDLQNRYSVSDGKLVVNEADPTKDSDRDGIPDNKEEDYRLRIFLHDTGKNESREIKLEEAQMLKLNDLLTSPDGVTISTQYNQGTDFLFFGGNSNYGLYLTKGGSRSRLELINPAERYYYRENFQFIGWILPGRS